MSLIAAQLYDGVVGHLDMWLCNALYRKEWEAGNYLVAALVSVRMSTEDVQTLSRYNISFYQLVHSYGVFFAALSNVASNSGGRTYRILDMREGVDPVELLFVYCTRWSPWAG